MQALSILLVTLSTFVLTEARIRKSRYDAEIRSPDEFVSNKDRRKPGPIGLFEYEDNDMYNVKVDDPNLAWDSHTQTNDDVVSQRNRANMDYSFAIGSREERTEYNKILDATTRRELRGVLVQAAENGRRTIDPLLKFFSNLKNKMPPNRRNFKTNMATKGTERVRKFANKILKKLKKITEDFGSVLKGSEQVV